jgi:hypothetical protein
MPGELWEGFLKLVLSERHERSNILSVGYPMTMTHVLMCNESREVEEVWVKYKLGSFDVCENVFNIQYISR